MPFKIGRNAVIRTRPYLEAGRVYLSDRIRIFSAHFTLENERHKGMRDFVEWHLPQIQYKNPDVQCLILRNLTPTAFIRAFTDDAEEVIIDVNDRERKEILKHVIKVLGKPEQILRREILAKQKKENPANFGYTCFHHCMCEIPGQVPCSGLIPLPHHRRGIWYKKNVLGQFTNL